MTQDLLSQWLDLPRTPWPPDHYVLLGLQPGQGTTDDIEQRVLERMEKLRRYQLREPEPVTEGMNLLAQALICLTEPTARIAYDRERGLHSIVEVPVEANERDKIPLVPALEIQIPPQKIRFAEPRPLSIPEIYSLDVDETDDASPEPIPDLIPLPEEFRKLPPPPDEVNQLKEQKKVGNRGILPVEAPHEREERRKIYAEIVRIRRVLHLWEKLRFYLDDPEKAFARRTETIAFMGLLAELRPLLQTVTDLVGGSNQPGHLVAVLSRQQLVVEMFRSLLSSQRESLSQDCRKAHYILAERYQSLRGEIRRLTAKSFTRRVWLPVLQAVIARPEWVFLAVGVLALAIAFYRSLPK